MVNEVPKPFMSYSIITMGTETTVSASPGKHLKGKLLHFLVHTLGRIRLCLKFWYLGFYQTNDGEVGKWV